MNFFDATTLTGAIRSDLSGVYLLGLEDKLAYVGKSKHILKRLREHFEQNRIPFDRFAFISADQDIDGLETLLIAAFQPVFNIGKKKIREVDLMPAVVRDMNVTQLLKLLEKNEIKEKQPA